MGVFWQTEPPYAQGGEKDDDADGINEILQKEIKKARLCLKAKPRSGLDGKMGDFKEDGLVKRPSRSERRPCKNTVDQSFYDAIYDAINEN
ncbi:MAG: hypothetical protein AB7U29_02250 [Desulfobulbus sp.]